MPLKLNRSLILTFFLSILLSACALSANTTEEKLYVPPTLAPHSNPVPTDTPVPVLPTATPSCENNLSFLKDVTIPDGTVFKAGDEIEKIWLVRNSGSCNWSTGYEFRLISGESLGVDSAQPLGPADAGSETELLIVFIAPETAGSYRSYWQAYDRFGYPFGVDFYVEIVVEEE